MSNSTSSMVFTSLTTSPCLRLNNEASFNDQFEEELRMVRTWFSVLTETERNAAFRSITDSALLREIEPLIQTLKDRKRELWRRQEALIIQPPEDKSKWPMPTFPHDSKDPRWLPKWLRALRLHKYEKCLEGMSTEEISKLTEKDMEEIGIDTVGARTKMLRVSHITHVFFFFFEYW